MFLAKIQWHGELSLAQVTETAKISYLMDRRRVSNARFTLAVLPPRHVRVRHLSKESDPYRQELDFIIFAALSEGKDRIASAVGCAHSHGCLDTRSATWDGAAMHFVTRSLALAYFAAGCTSAVLGH